MIISKKKFNEKVQEAIERAERERWMLDRIERAERECREMVEGVHRHLHDLEMKINEKDGKNGT